MTVPARRNKQTFLRARTAFNSYKIMNTKYYQFKMKKNKNPYLLGNSKRTVYICGLIKFYKL